MNFVKDSSIYVFGQVISKILPFLLIPYLTRSLGAEGFGLLSYYQAHITILLVFIGFSQQGAIARYYYYYGHRSIGLILSSSALISILITLVILFIATLFSLEIIVLASISALSQSLLNIQLSLRQCQKKAVSYVTIQLLSGVSSVVITLAIFELWKSSPESRVTAIIFANLTTVIFAFVYYKLDTGLRVNFSIPSYISSIKYIVGFGFPLLLHQFSFAIKGNVDRFIVYDTFDSSELGLYSSAFQLASILSILFVAVNKAIIPYLFEALKKSSIDANSLIKYSYISLCVSPLVTLIAYLLPGELYPMLLGEEFTGVRDIFVCFIFGISLVIPYFLLGNYLIFYGGNFKLSVCTTISALLHISMVFILSHISIVAVSLSMAISNLFSFFILTVAVRKQESEMGVHG